MPTFLRRIALPIPAADAFAWHERDGALERLSPPWEHVRVVEKHGTIRDGDRIVLTVAGTFGKRIEHVHRDYVPGRSFRDEQVRGLFARFSHTHEVIPDGDAACVMEDRIEYALPFGALGRVMGDAIVRARLDRMFTYRHETLRRDLLRHARAPGRRMRVAITGASGVIGRPLAAFLSTGGHDVVKLVRHAPKPGEVAWDPSRGTIDVAALERVDAIVHLAGENVGVRWTPERKERILRSRVDGTQLIAETCARIGATLVSASAIGIYGIERERADETSPLGDDFLADVCKQWEAATEPARAAGVRVVNARLGVVLSPAGGALAEMLPAVRFGVGGRIGSGAQVMSWVSLDDALGALHDALVTDVEGPINVVAPNPVTNAELISTLGRVLRRPTWLAVPAVAVRTVFGEMGELVALGGIRVDARRLVEQSFAFYDPFVEGWLRHVLGAS